MKKHKGHSTEDMLQENDNTMRLNKKKSLFSLKEKGRKLIIKAKASELLIGSLIIGAVIGLISVSDYLMKKIENADRVQYSETKTYAKSCPEYYVSVSKLEGDSKTIVKRDSESYLYIDVGYHEDFLKKLSGRDIDGDGTLDNILLKEHTFIDNTAIPTKEPNQIDAIREISFLLQKKENKVESYVVERESYSYQLQTFDGELLYNSEYTPNKTNTQYSSSLKSNWHYQMGQTHNKNSYIECELFAAAWKKTITLKEVNEHYEFLNQLIKEVVKEENKAWWSR